MLIIYKTLQNITKNVSINLKVFTKTEQKM